jgi:TRAP-type C4-dicarboxylate transport system permease small subunit
MKSKITNQLYPLILLFNWIASLTVIAMMLLTCIDVILRFLRCPIPGVFETIGLLGAIFVSFSLANTSLTQSHIAVDFLVKKLPSKIQEIIYCIHTLVATGLFGLLAWQSIWYALELRSNGEVSPTLQISTYPFVFGIAIGCFMLCLVLSAQFIDHGYAFITRKKEEIG